MIKQVLSYVATGSVMTSLMLGVAFADVSPNGPGQPGAPATTCQTYTVTPGTSANSQSPFSPTGQSGTVYAGNPGTASFANANSTHAVSQYDIACFQQTSH